MILHGFVKLVRNQPRKQLSKTNIEDKCKEYTKKINEKLRSLEVDLQNKADTIEIDRLQRRIENIEKSIRKLGGEDKEDKPWSTITGTSTKVEEVIQKSLKDRDIEERERQNRRKNIIVFGLPESDKPEPETRREEDIQKMVGLCRNICKIDITSRDVRRAVRLRKATENNERPLLIAMDEETKKQEIFLNLNKIRGAERPFNKVVMTHDLAVRQREELKELIKEANQKEQQDETGSFMYRVRGPPWMWKIARNK